MVTARLRRTTVLVLTLTAVVNALNYLRDAALAARFGASPASDALFSVLLLPALLQQMVVAGVLTPAVLPVYLELRQRDAAQAWRLIWQTLGGAALTLTLLTLIALAFAPVLTQRLFPGFDTAAHALALQAFRWLAPGAVCLALAGFSGVVLNAHNRFLLPAITPALASLSVLLALFWRPDAAVSTLAATLAVAFAVQFLIHLAILPAVGRPAGAVRSAASPNGERAGATPARRILDASLPLFLYVSLSQVATLVERNFASHLGAGAVARLTLAQKLASLPLFLIAGSLVVVIFPRLADLQEDRAAFRDALAAGLRLALPLLLISTVWLLSGSRLLVTLLYQHGRFSAADAAQTALLLQGYAAGLAPAGVGALLLKGLQARQDVRSPLWVGLAALIAYLVLATLGSRAGGALGLALALSATSLISTILLMLALARGHQALAARRLLADLLRLAPGTAAALALGLLLQNLLLAPPDAAIWDVGLRLAVLMGSVGGVFLIFALRAGFLGALRPRWRCSWPVPQQEM